MVRVTKAYFDQVIQWTPTLVPILTHSLDAGIDMIDTMLDEMTGGNLKSTGTLGGFYESIQNASEKQTWNPQELCPPQSHAGIEAANTSPGGQWTSDQISSQSIFPVSDGEKQINFYLHQPSKPHTAANGELITYVAESGLAQYEAQYRRSRQAPATKTEKQSSKRDKTLEDFANLLDPILEHVEVAFGNLAKDFETVIRSGHTNLGANLVKVIVTFSKSILKVIKDTIGALLNDAEKIIKILVSDLLNESVEIPFISSLWHHFTKQELPSALELLCVLFAIPTTVIAKIAAPEGSAPWPDLSAWSSGSAYQSFKVDKLDPKSTFDHIKAFMKGELNSQETNWVPATPSNFLDGPSEDDWSRWAKATIIAHPTATLLTSILQFANYSLKSKKASGGDGVAESSRTTFYFGRSHRSRLFLSQPSNTRAR